MWERKIPQRLKEGSQPEVRRQSLQLFVAAAMVTSLSACGGSGSSSNTAAQTKTFAERCASYASTTLPHNATLTKTEMRAASDTLPEVCIARGQIVSSPNSTINWAVELPAPETWNGKTITVGGGAFDGFIPTDSPFYQTMLGRSANPFVKMSSDSGHQSRGFEWAVDDVALRNHAFEANHMTLDVGTQIATEFYGRKPTRRYNMGHSNGGRAGLVASQRYPHDYDGVIALAPAISQQGHEANNVPLNHQIFGSPANWLSPAKIALYAQAETKACDALDGLVDGVVGNVEACNYVPTELLCTGADNDTCLTAGQIESIRQVYADRQVAVNLADGIKGYPRFGRGGAATSDWKSYLFGSSFAARDSFDYMVGDEAAKVVTRNPSTDYMTFDPTLYQIEWTRLSQLIDATNPNISEFADAGGKMLIWYGLADACVSVYRTAEYFDSVKRVLGTSKVQSFARFVSSPSVGHNLDGPGAATIDFVAAMDAWVERGQAPDNLVASKFTGSNVTPDFQRPACEYPKFPRYDGVGDPKLASSFVCSGT